MYLSGTSLVLEDTDDIIHQAEGEALEEWRSDKVDSFENNDGCQRAEWMKCLSGSIKPSFYFFFFFFAVAVKPTGVMRSPIIVVSKYLKY